MRPPALYDYDDDGDDDDDDGDEDDDDGDDNHVEPLQQRHQLQPCSAPPPLLS